MKGVFGHKGSCAQRNAALDAIENAPPVVFFFDDDVEVEERYVQNMLELYEEDSQVALANGTNLGLGAPPGTLTLEHAKALIRSNLHMVDTASVEPARTGLGSRMSCRGSLLGRVRFDERLPLYGYQEDFDFSMECAQYGKLVLNNRCLMVHMETTSGRMGSRRRGYSEVVNPIYIWSKGRGVKLKRILAGSIKRTLKNIIRCTHSDGRRRFAGNMIGWAMILRGKLEPEYITELKD